MGKGKLKAAAKLDGLRSEMLSALEAQQHADDLLVQELEPRWAALVETSNPLSALRHGMIDALESERAVERVLVERLERGWTAFTGEVFKGAEKYEVLFSKIADPARDPAMLPITLLGATDQERVEDCHTDLLCRLMDPSPRQSGELGLRLLGAFLKVGAINPVPSEVVLRRARIRREPRWEKPSGDGRYPDFVIEIPTSPSETWVVVENKIDHHDTEGQLDDYAELADVRHGGVVHRIFLTPDGHAPEMAANPERWQCMSYRTLALAWREVLAQNEADDAWTWMLRFYLGTVVQEIVGIRLRERLSPPQRATVIDYLEAATKG